MLISTQEFFHCTLLILSPSPLLREQLCRSQLLGDNSQGLKYYKYATQMNLSAAHHGERFYWPYKKPVSPRKADAYWLSRFLYQGIIYLLTGFAIKACHDIKSEGGVGEKCCREHFQTKEVLNLPRYSFCSVISISCTFLEKYALWITYYII